MKKQTLLSRQAAAIASLMTRPDADFEDLGVLKIITYTTERQGKKYPSAAIFRGNETRPSSQYYYLSDQSRDKAIQQAIKSSWADSQHKAERMQKRRDFVPNVKPGDIFVSSWGYDQTNVDYYQVIEVRGKAVILREITARHSSEAGGSMSCHVMPVKDQFKGEPFRKIISEGNYISSLHYAHLWDGRENYCSWYA